MDEHAKQLIFGFIALVAVWFAFGGTHKEISHEGVYLKPLAPVDSGTAYGGKYLDTPNSTSTALVLPKNAIDVKKIEQEIADFTHQAQAVQTEHDISYLSKNLIIDGKGGAGASDVNAEYVRLVANERNKSDVVISGLTLKSAANGASGVIPLGTKIPMTSQVHSESLITLSPSERAVVTTGESPIGTSFKVNMCSGYLEQFQAYTPALRQECPSPIEELKNAALDGDGSCADFVKTIPRCSTYTGIIPSTLSGSCKAFISQKLTYNGCVAEHQTERGFLGNEWRVFLGKSAELWRNKQEIVKLIDPQGNTVDAIAY